MALCARLGSSRRRKWTVCCAGLKCTEARRLPPIQRGASSCSYPPQSVLNPKTVPPVELWGPDPPSAHKEANYLAHVVRREGHPRSPPCRAPDHKSEAKASATVVARRGARIPRFISPQPSSAWTKVDPLGLPRTEEDEPASRCRLSVCPLPSYGTHLRRSGK